MKFFQLTQSEVQQYAQLYNTPLLILSLEQIKHNYTLFKQHLPTVKIHYAIKSNSDNNIIKTLIDLDSHFDVASDGEILDLISMGVSSDHIIYANPVKTPSGLSTAKLAGIYKFTYDSESEVYKLAREVPGSQVLLRIKMENSDALIDLNKKFGADVKEAISLLKLARNNNLNVVGLCFHVGSGSLNVEAYINALIVCRKIFDEAIKEGFNMQYLDIGGGFTSFLNDQEVDIELIFKTLNIALIKYFPDIEIWAEPGRFICANASNLITSVIGTTIRNNKQWYFLDEGIYGTFSGVIFDYWNPQFITFKNQDKIYSTLAGPSCDSMDIIVRDQLMESLEIGDLILTPNCGAYSTVTATNFNGFSKAKIIIYKK